MTSPPGQYVWDESGEVAGPPGPGYGGWAPEQPDPEHALMEDCVFKSNLQQDEDGEARLGWWDTDCGRVSAWGTPILALCEMDNVNKA